MDNPLYPLCAELRQHRHGQRQTHPVTRLKELLHAIIHQTAQCYFSLSYKTKITVNECYAHIVYVQQNLDTQSSRSSYIEKRGGKRVKLLMCSFKIPQDYTNTLTFCISVT